MCEQNRALDAEQPQRTIEDAIHCVWGASGGMDRLFDVIAMWRVCAPKITGCAFQECGHYIPEERPELLAQEIHAFGRR